MRFDLRLAGFACAMMIAAPADAVDDSGFVDWARANAVEFPACDNLSQPPALEALATTVGDARIVALGEPTHGAHEPLAFRNCLFRYLVEEQGFTAIALETGLNESRRLYDYAAGGEGEARDVARRGFTWGFWRYPQNIELLDWIRRYNLDPAHPRKIRLYGIDLSGGDSSGLWKNARATIDDSLAYLSHAAPDQSGRVRRGVQPFLHRFDVPGYSAMPAGDRARLRSAIADLIAFFDRNRRSLVAASSQADFDWARQNAVGARQLAALFDVSGLPNADGTLSPGDYRADAARDAAMAANAGWALEREGPQGRILVFAHNGHVMNARTRGGIWSVYAQAPAAMGEHLRAGLGRQLLIMAISGGSTRPETSRPPKSASLDAALARVGPEHFLIDFRRAGKATPAANWLAQTQSLRVNSDTENLVVPAAAFDAMLYFHRLTPAT
ncbi:erythromycin esterase family protein [Sphingopyxis witflariensis]|nr:erythromycin esterase family protein [Sphingopyxis witflariensis]